MQNPFSRKAFLIKFGTSLRERRRHEGCSIGEVGDRSGLGRRYIAMVERGERNPTLSTVERIARGLGIPFSQIFYDLHAYINPAQDFQQSGLVDHAGRPLRWRDEGSRALRSNLVLANEALLRYIARNPADIYLLSAREFEELVAEALRLQGYKVRLTPIARDGGKDMFVASHSALGAALYVVECKRYAPGRPVGVGIVRELYGVVQADRLTGGIVATTSYFSHDATQFTTRVKYQLSLADFAGVHAWIRTALNEL